MARRIVAVSVMAAVLMPMVGTAPTASAAGTARVRIVDNYNHSRIRISFDNVDRTMRYGDRTGFIEVTPDSMGNDVISVQALRYDRCGIAKIGWFFHAGHSYRVGVNTKPVYRCDTGGGHSV